MWGTRAGGVGVRGQMEVRPMNFIEFLIELTLVAVCAPSNLTVTLWFPNVEFQSSNFQPFIP